MRNFNQDMLEFKNKFPLQEKIIHKVPFTYRMAGEGKTTLVLLVGGLGMSEGLYNHALEFSKEYRVLLFDYPIKFRNNKSLVDGIASLIKELGLGKVVFIGQSYGGYLAQLIACSHKDIVKGLIMSNTGCLSEKLEKTEMKPLYQMVERMKKIKKMTWFIPVSYLRRAFMSQSMRYVQDATEEEQEYMRELFTNLFGKLTKGRERHMCNLMIDLLHVKRSKIEDFSYLEGKVLLLLSKDDDTFSDSIKERLIQLMPAPEVYDGLNGGHLALFLRIDSYISVVNDFIKKTL